ncbi:hypothetical protein EA462_05455 [Natrarchaeobius halalkaliphilus]|uniref:HEAT repeat domain-containing protein n=1 Tax=Natrarchaeobius halalkaliphilus TaxID=1679091 RepID=A0A3N6LPK2_9EURY|nr:hypothetical protein [Natrarchaeobius halalkaliphilus]RQG91418.1 hypothetical protein EA462_05455 [Natrarchaeobius halalkaliphilus]
MYGDGDGAGSVDQREGSDPVDLPSILAQLDEQTRATQRDAVRTVRRNVREQPERCMPTVPKLRQLLEEPSVDFNDEIAFCLAELAEESVNDVVPSVDGIVSFVAENPSSAAVPDLLRSLETVSSEHPGAITEHLESIVPALEVDDTRTRATAVVVIGRAASEVDTAAGETVDEIRSSLEERTRDDPDSSVRDRAEWALEQLPCSPPCRVDS